MFKKVLVDCLATLFVLTFFIVGGFIVFDKLDKLWILIGIPADIFLCWAISLHKKEELGGINSINPKPMSNDRSCLVFLTTLLMTLVVIILCIVKDISWWYITPSAVVSLILFVRGMGKAEDTDREHWLGRWNH